MVAVGRFCLLSLREGGGKYGYIPSFVVNDKFWNAHYCYPEFQDKKITALNKPDKC